MPKNYCLKKKGFTLIEILIVLAIISIIIVLGVSSYSIVRKKVRLDVAASTVQSIIVEAREKSRAGYYEKEGDISKATSFCFGFRLTNAEFIELLRTDYDRLAIDKKCIGETEELIIGEVDPDVVIKELEVFGRTFEDEIEVFFRPPQADIEISATGIDQDPIIRVVVGFLDSDNTTDYREIIFNALTGNVYTQKYTQKEPESIFN